MKSIDSLGLLEVFGLAAAIEGADAMLKSAQVRLVRQHELNPGLITLVVEGDLAACRAAVSAGKAAAARVGMVVGSHIIGRPDDDTESMILKFIPESSKETKKDSPNTKKADKSTASPKTAATAEKAATPIQAAAQVKQAEPAKVVQAALPKAAPPKKEVVATKKETVVTPKKETTPPVSKPAAPVVKQTPTPVKAPVATKKPATAQKPATKKPMTQAEFDRVMTYIGAIAKGCTWNEIKLHFPHDPEEMLKKLNEAVAAGRLVKAGANYRKV